jgi:hypothetical protein
MDRLFWSLASVYLWRISLSASFSLRLVRRRSINANADPGPTAVLSPFICVDLRSSAVERFCVTSRRPLTANLLRVVDSTVVNREPALTVYRVDLDKSPVPENLIVGIVDRALNWGWNHRIDTDDGG